MSEKECHEQNQRSTAEATSPSLEVLVDIARTIGEQRYVSGVDSRDDWRTMSDWAVEFQAQYDANPDAGETYIEDVEEFAIAKAKESGWTVCEPIEMSGFESDSTTQLEQLCIQTDTKMEDWELMNGPETGVGIERWYRYKDGREAYTVDDQGGFTIEVNDPAQSERDR